MLFSEYKFLVLDKTVFACQLVQDTLHELGARDIDYATRIADAVRIINSGTVDFLICEHDLETESGFDLIEKIRQHANENIKQMPVILLSSVTDRTSIFAGRDVGVDEIIAKPFTAMAIQARIEAIHNKRRKFVDERAYAGPDRRRLLNESYKGQNRRD